jgi:hypothetical protein
MKQQLSPVGQQETQGNDFRDKEDKDLQLPQLQSFQASM